MSAGPQVDVEYQPTPQRATRRDWIGLMALVLPCFLVSMDGHVLNLAAPRIVTDLRPSGSQLLWIMDGYVFMVAGSLLAMGALGDRIGRRRLLLIGVTFFSGGSLVAAFAPTPAALILGRVLMGLSGAALMPSTLALIRGMFADARQRTVALGVWSASFSLGGLLGPVVAGALLHRFWWGSVFLLAVPVTLLLLVAGPLVLPEFRDPAATRFDSLGAVQSLFALLAVVYAIKRVAEGRGLLTAAVAAAAGIGLGVICIRRQRRTATPMIELFHSPLVRYALLGSTLTFFALNGTNLLLAQYLQWMIGLSPLQAGLWTLPSVVAYLLGTAIGPVLATRFSRLRILAGGLLIAAVGCAVFVAVLLGSISDLTVVVTGSVVFALGLAPVYAMSTDLIVATTRPERAGSASAVAETGVELGGALGIALLGSLGVTVYRIAVSGATDGLPPGTRQTLGDALAVADDLPGVRGAELIAHARSAFEAAFAVVSGAASLAMLTALAAIVTLAARARRTGPDEAHHESPSAERVEQAATVCDHA
ncbi:MFS transporter [Actinoplanes sp. HUAS TT8]|uniref:MFS transporter n=1 Tax=Actinoplanes sp. HUAS TT8 TaxID=3447453 RepID=UPI003F520915